MNSKVKSVKQGSYESKRGCGTWLAFNLAYIIPSWPLYDIWEFGVHPILSNLLKYPSPKILYHDREFLI
jgi:hypothetical protein